MLGNGEIGANAFFRHHDVAADLASDSPSGALECLHGIFPGIRPFFFVKPRSFGFGEWLLLAYDRLSLESETN